MKLNIAQVIGLNTDQKAAQVTSAQRDGNSFLGVLTLSCDDAFTKGRQTLSELEDFYFEIEGTVAEKLAAAFTEAQKKLSNQVEFDLILAAISGKVLYLIGKGEVGVYLKREDKLSSLLQIASGQLVSGFVSAGDRLLFSTTSLVNFLGTDLGKSLQLPIENFEEEVGGKIGASQTEEQGLAALAVAVIDESEDIAPVEIEEKLQTPQPEYAESAVVSNTAIKNILSKIKGIASFLPSVLRTYFPKSGRSRLAIALILALVVSGGAGYKFIKNRDSEKTAQFNQILAAARDDFNSAKGLSSLNPVETKARLESAKSKVNQAMALKPKDAGAIELSKAIETETPAILKVADVADFPLFLDLDLIKKDFRAQNMSLSKGKLLLLDTGSKSLVSIDLAKKSNQILAGLEGLGEAELASVNGGFAFIYSKDKGILRVDMASKKQITVAKKDDGWTDIKDIYGFAGNIYLLDAGQIWKYLPSSGGYSDKREYLTKGTKADLSDAVRMQIESSIYVLKRSGEILRFTKGDKDNFSYEGLPSGVKEPKSLFVSSDTENLYLLDSGNSRLLTLTKTGSYKGQMSGAKFGSATDMVVDEVGKKLYLLEGNKIFQVDLK